MILELEDWRIQVDVDATRVQTRKNSLDHCNCDYCRNYYQAVSVVYPDLCAYLEQFGIDYNGPSEVMPFEPTLMLVCYRVQGKILSFGRKSLDVAGVSISLETADESSFYLWAGEMVLPWLQEIPEEDVISPANLPEFLLRMEQVWILRHGECSIRS